MRHSQQMEKFKTQVLSMQKAGTIPKDTWKKEYQKKWDIPAAHLASVLFRAKGKGYARAIRALSSAFSDKIVGQLPFVVATKDPTVLLVYPEIPMHEMAVHSPGLVATATIFTTPEILDPLLAVVKADNKHAKKCMRWETQERSKKTLLKHHKMGVSKLITRFTDAEKQLTPSGIRDKATKVEEELAPVCLHIAETPEEVADMYEGGPQSCMVTSSSEATCWREPYLEGKIGCVHPTWFYGHSPEISGAYIKRKGKIVARAMVYQLKGAKEKTYGSIYSATGEHNRKLKDLLEENGYKQESGGVRLTVSFRIPVEFSEYERDYLCPIPYVDNLLSTGIHVSFDSSKEEFVIDVSGTGSCNVSFGSTRGFAPAKEVTHTLSCSCCGNKLRGQSMKVHGEPRLIFCGVTCAVRMGFVQAAQKDGTQVLKHRGEVIHALPNRYYTTKASALYHGCLPVIHYLGERLTNSTPYAAGTNYRKVRYEGKPVFVPKSMHAALHNGFTFGMWKVASIDGGYEITKQTKFFDKNSGVKEIDW